MAQISGRQALGEPKVGIFLSESIRQDLQTIFVFEYRRFAVLKHFDLRHILSEAYANPARPGCSNP